MTVVRIALPRYFSFDAVVRSHGWYDLPPFSYDREAGILRTSVDGTPASFRARGSRLVADAKGSLLPPARLRAAARRIFSLDVELSAFDAALAGDPAMRRALRRGGGRMLRAPDAFEDAVKMLLTTNCSWEATRGMVVRLIALASKDGSFPRAEEVARFSPATLKARVRCGYRARALSRLARRAASGKLDLAAWEDRNRAAAAIRDAILAEDGFGPYAAEGLLRILGRHDFLALDSWVRQKYRRLHPGPKKRTDGAIARRYSRFGDFRGLAMWLELTDDWHSGASDD
jgi:N-glycosylase/DNA lyase